MIGAVLSPFGVVGDDGKPIDPGPSVFDAPPPVERPLEPSDDEIAGMQERIGDAYTEWDQRQAANPPPPHGAQDFGDGGEYGVFRNLIDADPAAQAELLKAVQDAVGPDAG